MSKRSGVLQLLPQGGAFLRQPDVSFQPSSDDVWVSIQTIQEYGLMQGAFVEGEYESSDRGKRLTAVGSVNGLSPDVFLKRTRFENLTVINPDKKIDLGKSDDISMRIIDLITPIGLGTRALIVAAPRTGKTALLESFAKAINIAEPNARIIALLIDERPEEVTHFRRQVDAEVLSSSLDESADTQIRLIETALDQIKCELECGKNVIVLADSLTRMARAFNNASDSRSGRTLSGGLDARALEIPRKFFGMARNVENGGSVTILATALVDTGSRMDEYVFQEFKGTGNCEIVLDRDLADQRIFPAVNIKESGTRKDELFFSAEEYQWINRMRSVLLDMDARKAAETLKKIAGSVCENKELYKKKLSDLL